MKGYKRVAAYVDLDAIEDNFEAMKANLKEKTRIAGCSKGQRVWTWSSAYCENDRKEGLSVGLCGSDH